MAPGVLVNITTPPHDTLSAVAASGFHVDSQCPYGLTIPEDLTKETIMWIPGSPPLHFLSHRMTLLLFIRIRNCLCSALSVAHLHR